MRHLEDELSKGEQKLGNFPDLRLSEADKVSVWLQAIQPEVRQYVVLRGRSNDWLSLTTSLKYYEEQLRMSETLGASNRAMSEILCDYCGKKGHKRENCWQQKRDERGEKGGKGDGKGKKGGGKQEERKGKSPSKGSGKGEKGKEKGKGKSKKKKKGQRAHSAESSASQSSIASEAPTKATAMALRFGGEVRVLNYPEVVPRS